MFVTHCRLYVQAFASTMSWLVQEDSCSIHQIPSFWTYICSIGGKREEAEVGPVMAETKILAVHPTGLTGTCWCGCFWSSWLRPLGQKKHQPRCKRRTTSPTSNFVLLLLLPLLALVLHCPNFSLGRRKLTGKRELGGRRELRRWRMSSMHPRRSKPMPGFTSHLLANSLWTLWDTDSL